MTGKLSLNQLKAESGVQTLDPAQMRTVLGGLRPREGTNCRYECGSTCGTLWHCCNYGTETCCESGGQTVCGAN